MKILHLSRNFYPCIGGTEKYISELSRRLVKRGLASRVLVLNYNIFNKRQIFPLYEKVEGIEVFRVPGLGRYKKPIPLNIPVRLFGWADVVHVHDLRLFYETALLLKPLFSYRICLSTHGFILHTEELRILKSLLIPTYYKATFRYGVDAVVCDSRQDYDYFQPWKIARLYLIENGIDYEKFSRARPNPVPGRLLYFGRIDHNKGLDLLFETLALVKSLDWHLQIVGDGPAEIVATLKLLAQRLDVSQRISWRGFLAEDALLEELERAHLCLFPSRYEGFGYTLLEAMASGAVGIANAIDTYKSIVQSGETGFIVNYSDPLQSASEVRRILLVPPETLLSVSRKAREKAKEFDWEKKVDEIIQVYSGKENV